MSVRVVTDSTADLDPALAKRLGITVVPLHVHFGEEVFESGITISKTAFYARMDSSEVLPRTSQPSAGAFQQAYEQLRAAEGIVSVHISGKLSGTLNAAQTAAGLLDADAPPLEVVDSNQASMGLGFATLAAAETAAAGGDLASVVAAARETAARCRVLLFVDTLEYLHKGGRIGRARAFLGTLLRTRPLLELRDGEITGIERPRTRTTAMTRLFDLIVRTPGPEKIAVMYGSTPEEAETLAAQVRERLPAVEVSVVQVSPVVGVHTGPGAMGAAILRAVP